MIGSGLRKKSNFLYKQGLTLQRPTAVNHGECLEIKLGLNEKFIGKQFYFDRSEKKYIFQEELTAIKRCLVCPHIQGVKASIPDSYKLQHCREKKEEGGDQTFNFN